MVNNKNPQEKQPGEKPPGKFHYNPGNMSGKKIGAPENEGEDRDRTDKKQARPEDREKDH
jgi:hypothetical protein